MTEEQTSTSDDRRDVLYTELHRAKSEASESIRQAARTILPLLFQHHQPKSILDVGCGTGTWLAVAKQMGVNAIHGVEGNWLDTKLLEIDSQLVTCRDLEQPFDLQRKFDLAISLEVAEHVSPQAASPLVASLVRHSDVVLFSAAIPLQGGVHHVNEQWQSFWSREFESHHFVTIDFLRPRIWHDSTVYWWLRQNILLFAKRQLVESHPKLKPLWEQTGRHGLLDVVHPDLYKLRTDSLRACQDVLEHMEDRALSMYLRGMLAYRQGQFSEAADLLRRAIQIQPDNGKFQSHASEVFRRAGRLHDALTAARNSVRLASDLPATHNNLGLALQDNGNLAEAEQSFRQAVALNRGYAKAHHNLGNLLRQQQRLHEAQASFRAALRIQPDYPQALNGLGLVLKQQYQPQQAVAFFQQALSRRPNYPQALLNLGNTLAELEQHGDAENCLRRAIQTDPQYVQAYHDLGTLLEGQKRLPEAIEAYRRAAQLNPSDTRMLAALENTRRHACDWSGQPESIQRLLTAVRESLDRGEPSPLWPAASIRFPTTNADRLAIAQNFARGFNNLSAAAPSMRKANNREKASRIRLGFLSHEFGEHIVSHLMQGVYGRFDRARFEVFAFAYSPDDGSQLRRRIAENCDHFIEITGLTPPEAARRIAAEDIHILVDMNSYMPRGRPEIAAHRPAPVQVSYRYPATMGADWIDYLLADRFVTPPGSEQFYSEKLVYLPDAYLVTSYETTAENVSSSRADWGLPEDGFVFCCFNQSHKLTPNLFDVWMRILGEVPGGVLWQLEDQPAIRATLQREAVKRGILAERLVFAPKVPIDRHLARFAHADLLLDTLVHGAIVTAADALWAGLPLLTCPGDTFTSRAAASLNNVVGLPELNVTDLNQYEQLAVQLALDRDRMRSLRDKLATGRESSPLFDTGRFVRGLERAFLEMWRIHEAGQPPRAIEV